MTDRTIILEDWIDKVVRMYAFSMFGKIRALSDIIEVDDLIQAGYLGACLAYRRSQHPSYVRRWIYTEMVRCLCDFTPIIPIKKNQWKRFQKELDHICGSDDREPLEIRKS